MSGMVVNPEPVTWRGRYWRRRAEGRGLWWRAGLWVVASVPGWVATGVALAVGAETPFLFVPAVSCIAVIPLWMWLMASPDVVDESGVHGGLRSACDLMSAGVRLGEADPWTGWEDLAAHDRMFRWQVEAHGLDPGLAVAWSKGLWEVATAEREALWLVARRGWTKDRRRDAFWEVQGPAIELADELRVLRRNVDELAALAEAVPARVSVLAEVQAAVERSSALREIRVELDQLGPVEVPL